MVKKVVKKTATPSKPVSRKTSTVKKTTVPGSSSKRKNIRIAKKTTESKDSRKGKTAKKSTPPKSKGGKKEVKIESHSREISESSGLDKLDTIILTKSRKESNNEEIYSGSNTGSRGNRSKRKGKALKIQVEEKTKSGDSRSNEKKESQESLLKRSAKQQISGKVDTQSISEELSKIMKKIEVKKFESSKSPPKTGQRSSKHKQKVTAKSQNYTVHKNPKVKSYVPIIELQHIPNKQEFNNTDIILAILEIGYHRECYIFPNSPKSNSFWEEIVQFNEFKRIFQFYRPETLKKYWRLLSYKNTLPNAIRIINDNKKFLDEKKPK
jgi:hypothetical protein